MSRRRTATCALAVALLMVAFHTTPFLAQGTAPAKPVSFVVSADYDAGTLSKAAADIELIRDLEVHGWNGRIAWDLLEPQRARPLLDALHQAASAAEGYDIDVHLTLTAPAAERAAPVATAAADEASGGAATRVGDVQRAASLLATEMTRHRNVRSYAIDLPGGAAAAPAAIDDGGVLTAMAAAIRARHPAAAVVFAGLSPASTARLQRVCTAANAARAFSTVRVAVDVHTALDAVTPAAAGDLQAFAASVDRACGRKRIWLEASAAAAASEREEAAAWVRAIATAIAEPRVEQVVIGLRDGSAAGNGVTNAGLVRGDGTKKMLFSTVDMLTDLFGTETVTVDTQMLRVTPSTGGELHAHLFTRRDGDRVLIAWNRTSASTVKIEVPGTGSSVEFGVDGRPLHWDQNAEPLANLTLSPGVPRIFRLAPRTS